MKERARKGTLIWINLNFLSLPRDFPAGYLVTKCATLLTSVSGEDKLWKSCLNNFALQFQEKPCRETRSGHTDGSPLAARSGTGDMSLQYSLYDVLWFLNSFEISCSWPWSYSVAIWWVITNACKKFPPSKHITHPSETSFAGHNGCCPLGAGGDQAAAPCLDPAIISKRASWFKPQTKVILLSDLLDIGI